MESDTRNIENPIIGINQLFSVDLSSLPDDTCKKIRVEKEQEKTITIYHKKFGKEKYKGVTAAGEEFEGSNYITESIFNHLELRVIEKGTKISKNFFFSYDILVNEEHISFIVDYLLSIYGEDIDRRNRYGETMMERLSGGFQGRRWNIGGFRIVLSIEEAITNSLMIIFKKSSSVFTLSLYTSV